MKKASTLSNQHRHLGDISQEDDDIFEKSEAIRRPESARVKMMSRESILTSLQDSRH
jgi:hypothetical protein